MRIGTKSLEHSRQIGNFEVLKPKLNLRQDLKDFELFQLSGPATNKCRQLLLDQWQIRNVPYFPIHEENAQNAAAEEREQYGMYYNKNSSFTIPKVSIPQAHTNASNLPPWVQGMEQTAKILNDNWDKEPHILIELDLQLAADYTQYLLDHALCVPSYSVQNI
jgi:hypothetical protein